MMDLDRVRELLGGVASWEEIPEESARGLVDTEI